MTSDQTHAARTGKRPAIRPHARAAGAHASPPSDPGAAVWQEHARRSFAAARGSGRDALDTVRLLQTRRMPPPGEFVRRGPLARAFSQASRR